MQGIRQVPTGMTVADRLLLCLWVPLLETAGHTDSSHSLGNSRDMLVPASSLPISLLCAAEVMLRAVVHQLHCMQQNYLFLLSPGATLRHHAVIYGGTW